MLIKSCRPSFATAMLMIGAVATLGARPVPAQGLSGASVEGAVVTDSGTPVRSAIVILTELATGAVRRITAGDRGSYLFENVAVGSYRIEAMSMGMLPAAHSGIVLHIGDRLHLPLVLGSRSATELERVVVRGAVLRDAGAGGPSHSIPREAIRSLPLLNRDFVRLFSISPQAAGPGLWVSGQHGRFNAIQIDGAIGNDVFGTNITPGSNVGGKSVTLEALEEIRILVAPFDVRQGGFSGGLINAVTRSGSNTHRGSLFSLYSRSELVGQDTAGAGVSTFDQLQYGASAGGPIVRDRLHYFAVAEAQSRSTQFSGPSVDDILTGVTRETAARAARVVRERFGFDPGGPEAPELRQPNTNLFLKLSWHPSENHSVELTQSLLRAQNDGFNRILRNQNNVEGWQLSNSGTRSRSTALNTRLKSVGVFGTVTNEAIAAFGTTDDQINSRNRVPLYMVQADVAGHYLAAGSVKSAQGTRTTRNVIELTDNLSWHRGAHLLTLGTQNVVFQVRDNFSLGRWGVWTFESIDALENGQPSRYEVALPLTDRGPVADYSSALLSAYAQDQWRHGSRFSITAGLRIDIPFFEAPQRNAVLLANQQLQGIDTGEFPSGNTVVAPRVGFAWRLGSASRSMLRGGVGVFTGRPPLVWLTGAFSSTGQEQTTLVCGPAQGVPVPTSDITRLPTSCLSPGPTSLPSVSYFDSNFRFQRAIKYVLGFDHHLRRSLLASLDVIHTTSRDNMFMSDVNLVERGATSEGRAMYGAITSGGVARPTRADSIRFGPVFRYWNVNSDRSTSVSISVQRQWQTGSMVQIGYNWSHTMDLMSLSGLISPVIFRTNPIDGTLAHRNLRRSARDIPHSFAAIAILPLGSGTTISGFFRARSGTPYAFSVRGDANADGAVGNDLAYIPAGLDDFALANPEAYPALDSLIERMPCLRRQRGRMMQRNTCRNPAVTTLDGRVAKKLRMRGDRGFEISADIFNIPNIISRNWGLVRETAAREEVPLLTVTGWDAAMNRPRYSIPVVDGRAILPPIAGVVPEASRWRVQIGARYDF